MTVRRFVRGLGWVVGGWGWGWGWGGVGGCSCLTSVSCTTATTRRSTSSTSSTNRPPPPLGPPRCTAPPLPPQPPLSLPGRRDGPASRRVRGTRGAAYSSHTHTRARAHTHTHTHMTSLGISRTCAHMDTCMQTHTCGGACVRVCAGRGRCASWCSRSTSSCTSPTSSRRGRTRPSASSTSASPPPSLTIRRGGCVGSMRVGLTLVRDLGRDLDA